MRHSKQDLLVGSSGLSTDKRGFAATEFAMIFPVAIALFVGLVDISEGVAISRKVTITARTITDLISQNVNVSTASVNMMLNAAAAIAAPYPKANMVITVSEVSTDASGNATVTWSQSLNGTPLNVGKSLTLPVGIGRPNISLIWGQVSYNYSPFLYASFIGNTTLSSQIYLSPRLSNSILLTP
jgi:Flp pilus assembly protein TadG